MGTQTQRAVFGIAPPRVSLTTICTRLLGVALGPEGPHAFTTISHRTTTNSTPEPGPRLPLAPQILPALLSRIAAGSRCPGFHSYCGRVSRGSHAHAGWRRVVTRCPGGILCGACPPEHPLLEENSPANGDWIYRPAEQQYAVHDHEHHRASPGRGASREDGGVEGCGRAGLHGELLGFGARSDEGSLASRGRSEGLAKAVAALGELPAELLLAGGSVARARFEAAQRRDSLAARCTYITQRGMANEIRERDRNPGAFPTRRRAGPASSQPYGT